MSETLTKAQWQEKKKSHFERQRRAAVSVQTARIIDKLLERSKGLSASSYENRTNAITASESLQGAEEGKPEAVLTKRLINYNIGEDIDSLGISTSEHKVKPLLRKERAVKTAHITRSSRRRYTDYRDYDHQLNVDSKGRQRPFEVNSYGYGAENRYTHNLGSEQIVSQAAPALYEMKKAIDDAEEQQARRAA